MVKGKRPFWMHQLVEYILGGALVYSGLMSPEPTVPAVCGGLIVLNAALTKGALGAFRAYGRRIHQLLDYVVIAFGVVAALQPWVSVDNGSRAVILAVLVVEVVVVLGSNFAERQKTPKPATGPMVPPSGDRSTDLGRTAGRVVGSGVNAVRKLRSGDDKGGTSA